MNAKANFFSHVDKSAGPDASWPWLLTIDGRGRAGIAFKAEFASFITWPPTQADGQWPRHSSVKPWPRTAVVLQSKHVGKQ